jgi:hypothetical protein
MLYLLGLGRDCVNRCGLQLGVVSPSQRHRLSLDERRWADGSKDFFATHSVLAAFK